MKFRPASIILLLLLLSMLTGMVLKLISNKAIFALDADKKTETNVRYFKAVQLTNQDLQMYLEGQGRVSSTRKLDISSEVQGMLMPGAKSLKPGTTFKQGEVLFQIRDTEARLSLQARKSSYLNVIANILADIKLDYPDNFESWKKFFESIDITKNLPELPVPKSMKEKTFIATKNIFGEYYLIKADEERLRKYTYVAPFNGSITEVFAEPGSMVNPGVRLASVIQSNQLEIEIPIEAASIKEISIGSLVELIGTGGDLNFKGKVIRIGDFVNKTTQSVPVYVSIDEGDLSSLYNGMYLNAKIATGVCKECFELPRRALFNDTLYYAIKDSALEIKRLKIERLYQESAIVSHVKNNSVIVIEPVVNYIDTIKVAPLFAK